MLDQLTVETFQPLVGSRFMAEFPNGTSVELELVAASKVMESEAARLDRHPFSLFFIGPKSFLLKQHVYHLTHATLAPLDLFLVPVGDGGDVHRYEAVFT